MIRYLLVLLSQALLLSLLSLSLLVSDSIWPRSFEPEVEEHTLMNETSIIGEEFARGKALFKANCASCHNKNMSDPLTGPALGGVMDRWKDYPIEDLYRWIRNSALLIEEKHDRAVMLWNEWDQYTMNAFPNLTDEDIEDLLVYIEQ